MASDHASGISVVIPTYGRDALYEAVASILQQTRPVDELIVVDEDVDGSGKDLLDDLPLDEVAEFRYVQRECGGLTSAKNYAAAEATQDVVLFLDDDATLEPDAVATLLDVYAEYDPDGVWILSDDDHSHLEMLYERAFHHGPFDYGLRRKERYPERVGQFAPTRAMGGCGMSVRRYVLDEVTFDERDPVAFLPEDIDFSYRVSERFSVGATAATRKKHKQVKRNNLTPTDLRESTYRKVYAYDYLFRKTLDGSVRYLPHYLLAIAGVVVAATYSAIRRRRIEAVEGVLTAIAELLGGTTVEERYLTGHE
jgi:glycosyltransferase involved in cell wall biosynthesis